MSSRIASITILTLQLLITTTFAFSIQLTVQPNGQGKYKPETLELILKNFFLKQSKYPFKFADLIIANSIPHELGRKHIEKELIRLKKYDILKYFSINENPGNPINSPNEVFTIFNLISFSSEMRNDIEFFNANNAPVTFLNYNPEIDSTFKDIKELLILFGKQVELNMAMTAIASDANVATFHNKNDLLKQIKELRSLKPQLKGPRLALQTKRINDLEGEVKEIRKAGEEKLKIKGLYDLFFTPWTDPRLSESHQVLVNKFDEVCANEMSAFLLLSIVYSQYDKTLNLYNIIKEMQKSENSEYMQQELQKIQEKMLDPLFFAIYKLNQIATRFERQVEGGLGLTQMIQENIDNYEEAIARVKAKIKQDESAKKKAAKKRAKKKRQRVRQKARALEAKAAQLKAQEEPEAKHADDENEELETIDASHDLFKKKQNDKLNEWQEEIASRRKAKKKKKKQRAAQIANNYEAEQLAAATKELQDRQDTLKKSHQLPSIHQKDRIYTKLSGKNLNCFRTIFGLNGNYNRVIEASNVLTLGKALSRLMHEEGIQSTFLEELKTHPRHTDGKKLPRDYVDKLRSFFIIFGLIPQEWNPQSADDFKNYQHYLNRLQDKVLKRLQQESPKSRAAAIEDGGDEDRKDEDNSVPQAQAPIPPTPAPTPKYSVPAPTPVPTTISKRPLKAISPSSLNYSQETQITNNPNSLKQRLKQIKQKIQELDKQANNEYNPAPYNLKQLKDLIREFKQIKEQLNKQSLLKQVIQLLNDNQIQISDYSLVSELMEILQELRIQDEQANREYDPVPYNLEHLEEIRQQFEGIQQQLAPELQLPADLLIAGPSRALNILQHCRPSISR